ncbi:PIG-L family deacetylase [Acinetobacter wanghuae]|uniref:PIG-L family deacetylase n=1 Tax=Acinetobacter wanghuae TaxID=2662362 RepID=A0A5Q0P3B7_9GAMM|nr:PIG-L family deacetylase [Acinetobacter wanghuae]MQW92588.1 PIG-L family deacetylase [Acinetobacter wanghuae]QGA11073.1 PIG-L family deacetylase [Acinetobacter wanghuae]
MDTIDHPLVGDRLIYGEGTSVDLWQNGSFLNELNAFEPHSFFAKNSRVCLIAPHPDDEILGCAGLIQQLDALGLEIILFAVTNGTASHPNSDIYSRHQLNKVRPYESLAALKSLGLQHNIQRIELGIPDGEIYSQKRSLEEKLCSHLKPHDVLITTFEKDGHPDHEACGQVVRQIAQTLSLSYLQVLIWAWHWAKPQDARIPWDNALKLTLSPEQLERKALATACFESQLMPDPSTGQAAILSKTTLDRLLQPWEVYLHGD